MRPRRHVAPHLPLAPLLRAVSSRRPSARALLPVRSASPPARTIAAHSARDRRARRAFPTDAVKHAAGVRTDTGRDVTERGGVGWDDLARPSEPRVGRLNPSGRARFNPGSKGRASRLAFLTPQTINSRSGGVSGPPNRVQRRELVQSRACGRLGSSTRGHQFYRALDRRIGGGIRSHDTDSGNRREKGRGGTDPGNWTPARLGTTVSRTVGVHRANVIDLFLRDHGHSDRSPSRSASPRAAKPPNQG